jgi:BirA family transcriptional regulator, biotin operon repressor / biotin---[acetyl-CoA-carboxylase] ligase
VTTAPAAAAYDRARVEAALLRGGETRRLEIRDEVPSTQDLAFNLAEYGAPDGSLVVADRQTRGRGRLGRTWESPAGAGVWFSAVLRPPASPPPRPPLLVAATAVAVSEALERATGVRTTIRWPNDLLAGERKIAGILLETRDYEPAAPLLVLGVGIDTGQEEADFPPDLRDSATSVRMEKGAAPDRTAVLVAMIEAVDRWRARVAGGAHGAVEEAFRDRAAYLERPVTLLDGSVKVAGVLLSVSPVDGVVVVLPDGSRRTVRPEHARELRPA